MKILFVHEVNWRKKPIYEIHDYPELLSLRGHEISFIDFPEGEYRLNRQGLNQMCELNLIEVVKKSEKVLVHTDGEYIVIVNSVDSTFTLDVIVDDQNVTQWKLTN